MTTPDPNFEAFVEASEQAREIAAALLENSPTYQAALKKAEDAWKRCLKPELQKFVELLSALEDPKRDCLAACLALTRAKWQHTESS